MRASLGPRYILGECIGGGGMAEVFAGHVIGDHGFMRDVAIKRMLPEICRRAGFDRMFVREARLASMLEHPNIVSVLDFDRDADGHHFLVMERVVGVDVHDLMSAGPVPVALGVFMVAEVLRALAYAHELMHGGEPLGIVHRDISPHNVMLSRDGEVKLVDFGVARTLTAAYPSLAGSVQSVPGVRGKVAYMSPEQVHGVELDGRADVFSTGVLLYELLTQTRLFAASTPLESVHLVLRKKLVSPRSLRPEIPLDLADVCLRMLARDRRARFDSARAALHALEVCTSMVPGDRATLGQLVCERFADVIRPVTRQPLLSERTVPLVPSLVIADESGAPGVVHAVTRTALDGVPASQAQRARQVGQVPGAQAPQDVDTVGVSRRAHWLGLLVAFALAAVVAYLAMR